MKYVEKALEKIDPGATEATGEPITAATDLKACACNYTYILGLESWIIYTELCSYM